MLSKNQIKQIQALQQKKHRAETNCFVAEGSKLVADMIGHFECKWLIATRQWLESNHCGEPGLVIETDKEHIAKASSLSSPPDVIAIFKKPEYTIDTEKTSKQLAIALDCVQDPGNLGTIIRLADWFGIENIYCSTDTADVYNPKTVQATMGALSRVKVHYVDMAEFLSTNASATTIYGTFLDGDNMYETDLTEHGIIVMGNEGNGISPEIEQQISKRLYIPNFPSGTETSESLNVAVATAIVCAEFRRRVR